MSNFSVRIKETENAAHGMDVIYRKILNNYDRVESVRNNLYQTQGMAIVRTHLTSLLRDMDNEAKSMDILADKMREIASRYQQTENRIVGNGNIEGTQISAEAEADISNVEAKEEKSWWEEIKELFDQDQNNDEWWQRMIRDLMLTVFPPAGLGKVIMDLYEIWDDDTEYAKVIRQVIGGNWVEDSSGLGIALSIVVGMIPVVGQIADVRDLVADIHNLIKDGATAEEWVSLGLSTIAFIPIAGDVLKHGDEGAEIIKGLSKHLPEFTEGAQKFLRNADEFAEGISNSKIVKKVKSIQEGISAKTTERFKDFVRDQIDDIPGLGKVKEQVDDVIQDVRDYFTKPGKKKKPYDILDMGEDFTTKLVDVLLKNQFKDAVGNYYNDKMNSLQAAG